VGQSARNWKPDEFHKFFIRLSLHTSGRQSARLLAICNDEPLDPILIRSSINLPINLASPHSMPKVTLQATNARSTIALQQNNTRGFIAKDFAGELFFAR
jgi:hypothetical protein